MKLKHDNQFYMKFSIKYMLKKLIDPKLKILSVKYERDTVPEYDEMSRDIMNVPGRVTRLVIEYKE